MSAKRWEVRLGDSRRLLATLEPASVDLVLTDAPYSSGGAFRGDRTQSTGAKYDFDTTAADFAGDNRDQRAFTLWCELWIADCARALKPGGIFAGFMDWRQLPAFTDAVQCAGLVWRGVSAWLKPNARPQQGRPRQDCEFVVWATRGPRALEGPVGPRSLVEDPPKTAERLHQTQKPVRLLQEWCKLAPPSGLVLDPFCGSGSTGEAALTTGRRFLGFEVMPHYHRVASERLAAIGDVGEAVSASQPSLFGDAS